MKDFENGITIDELKETYKSINIKTLTNFRQLLNELCDQRLIVIKDGKTVTTALDLNDIMSFCELTKMKISIVDNFIPKF